MIKPLARAGFRVDRFYFNGREILQRIGWQLFRPLNLTNLAVLFWRDGNHNLRQANFLITFTGKQRSGITGRCTGRRHHKIDLRCARHTFRNWNKDAVRTAGTARDQGQADKQCRGSTTNDAPQNPTLLTKSKPR
ncbi:hypothetical protein D3C80_570840 [compost metagenome]